MWVGAVMMGRSTFRLAIGCGVLVACSSSRLDDSNFACESHAECGPDQWCVALRDGKACRATLPTPIVIGMSGALRGPDADLAVEMRRGILAALRRVNDDGGVHGREVELRSANDDDDSELAVQRTRELLEAQPVGDREGPLDVRTSDGALALVGSVGTDTVLAAVPVAAKAQVAVFGPATGSRAPPIAASAPYVYHYRASYFEEGTAMLEYLRKAGRWHVIGDAESDYQRILVFAEQDGYGDSGYQGVAAAYEQNVAPLPAPDAIARVGYARGDLASVDAAVVRASSFLSGLLARGTLEREPVAIVMIDAYRAGNRFIRRLKDWVNADASRASRLDVVFLHVSSVGSDSLAAALTATPSGYRDVSNLSATRGYAENVFVTQVVPDYRSLLPGVVRYREDIREFDDGEPTFASLEGHLVARFFLEALERSGSVPLQEDLIRTLDTQMVDVDLGIGIALGFSPKSHQASHSVWGIQLGDDGNFAAAFVWSPGAGFQALQPPGTGGSEAAAVTLEESGATSPVGTAAEEGTQGAPAISKEPTPREGTGEPVPRPAVPEAASADAGVFEPVPPDTAGNEPDAGGAAGGSGGTTGAGGAYRYARLVALSELDGVDPFSAVAELALLDAGGSAISRAGWTASADSEDREDTPTQPPYAVPGSPASYAIDGRVATFWHTDWFRPASSGAGDPLPHWLQVDLGTTQEVKGFVYTPRQDHPNGRIRDWEFHLTNDPSDWSNPDPDDWGTLVVRGSFPDGTQPQTVMLP